jgi:hypothetical protein
LIFPDDLPIHQHIADIHFLHTDPGVHGPIQEVAEANPYEKEEELEEEEEEDFLDPRSVVLFHS